jgi:hypothetical protein
MAHDVAERRSAHLGLGLGTHAETLRVKLVTGTSSFTPLDVLLICLTLLCVAIAFVRPGFCGAFFVRIEKALAQIADRPRVAMAILFALPLVLRALLLPVYGVPKPAVHDEYGYLLQADTFASGRIANPPPPFPKHFESIYVLTEPTYTSQYQPAQGLLLGAAQRLTGWPWLGVFLSVGILCALLYWMLLAWLPPVWALTGGLLAVFQFGVLSYWMNSYFGGTLPAIGGTLVLGALPRIRKSPSVICAVLSACGIVLLINSRPVEGFLLLLIAIAAIYHWLFIAEVLPPGRFLRNIFAPAAIILLAAAGFSVYYNYRVTGHMTELPYSLNRKLYGTPQGFFWQKPFYVHTPMPCDIRQEYEQQLRNHERRTSLRGLILATAGKVRTFWSFYFGPSLTIPLLFILFIWRGRNMALVFAATAAVAFYNLSFFAFVPHYAAAITGLILLIIVLCLRRMRAGGPSSLFLARSLPLVCALGLLIPMAGRLVQPILPSSASAIKRFWTTEFPDPWPREKLLADLLKNGSGNHLILVRYNCAEHIVDDEWVFNRADLEHARVVWARELDPASDRELIRHFAGRQIWLAEPDMKPPRILKLTERLAYAQPRHFE